MSFPNDAASLSWPLAATVYDRFLPQSTPVGRFMLFDDTAAATSSMPMPRLARARGSSWMRAAYFCEPMTFTLDTPLTVEIRCASTVCANSSSCDSGRVCDRTMKITTGKSDGFDLLVEGGMMPDGRSRSVFEM